MRPEAEQSLKGSDHTRNPARPDVTLRSHPPDGLPAPLPTSRGGTILVPLMKLSARVRGLKPSATMALDARAKAMKRSGVPIISLAVGEPDFDTPQPIKDTAIRALGEGATRYVEAAGIPELREAISVKLARDQKLSIPPEQISVTSGAKQAVFNAFQAP